VKCSWLTDKRIPIAFAQIKKGELKKEKNFTKQKWSTKKNWRL